MESLGIDWKILIGQLINFAILFYLLKRFAFKPFFSMLEKRKAKIEEGIKKSEEAEKSLQKIKVLSREIRENGEKGAREIIKEAEGIAQKRAEALIMQAGKERKQMLETAQKMIEKEALEERKSREKEAVEKAFILAQKFLEEKTNEEKDKKFIEELLVKMTLLK